MYDEKQLIKDIRTIARSTPIDGASAESPPEVDLARSRLQEVSAVEIVEFIAKRSLMNGPALFDRDVYTRKPPQPGSN